MKATGVRITWRNRMPNATSIIYRSNAPFDSTNLPTPIFTSAPGDREYIDWDATPLAYNYYRIGTEFNGQLLLSELIRRYGVEPRVYVGGTGNSVIMKDSEGDNFWTFTGHTSNINAVAVSPEGYVYTASIDSTVKKLDPYGSVVWTFNRHMNGVDGMVIDLDENVISVSGSGENAVMWKCDKNGNEIWYRDGFDISFRNSICVDKDGFIYTGSSDQKVRKISPDGEVVWVYEGHVSDDPEVTTSIRALAVDKDGFVYSGAVDTQAVIHKITPTGESVWVDDELVSTSTVFNGGLYVDQEFNYYHTLASNIMKKDKHGKEVWSSSAGSTIQSITTDADGSVYCASSGSYTEKLNGKTGERIWRTRELLSQTMQAIDVYPGRLIVSQGLMDTITEIR